MRPYRTDTVRRGIIERIHEAILEEGFGASPVSSGSEALNNHGTKDSIDKLTVNYYMTSGPAHGYEETMVTVRMEEKQAYNRYERTVISAWGVGNEADKVFSTIDRVIREADKGAGKADQPLIKRVEFKEPIATG